MKKIKVKILLKNFINSEEGVHTLEYVLFAAAVYVAVIKGLMELMVGIAEYFDRMVQAIASPGP